MPPTIAISESRLDPRRIHARLRMGRQVGLDLRTPGLYHGCMGKTYLYECGLCHYRVKVSGGTDAGVDCDIQTVVCRDCRELFDVFTRVRRQSSAVGKFNALHPEIPPAALAGSPARGKPWKESHLACPMEHKHRVEPWKDPGRCPRCGSYLEKTGLPVRVWE